MKTFRLALGVLIWAAMAAGALAGQVQLTAHRLDYDPRTERFRAEGDVVVRKDQLEARGSVGEGTVDGHSFTLRGDAVAVSRRDNVTVRAQTIQVNSLKGGGYSLSAQGNVRATRGDETITCQSARWDSSGRSYVLKGAIKGTFLGRQVDADQVQREGASFSGVNVRRYADLKGGFEVSARRVDGTLGRNDQVLSATAEGDLTFVTRDREGRRTVLTGDRGSYSVADDTLTVSGSARAVQEGGRTISAQRMVYHIAARRLEAQGAIQVTFPVRDGGSEGEKR
ncbi:OstA family protein [Thermanaerovibrio acidaminovorans DSM 6589]|uniref:OstA family protein n=1 Tax=Thermanaerovibrio acidaminovorans (strain ATCC 49978 / DSM 6589 / Su883) TaxID=525903 RepID=D1B627_THEAS|nr:LptA/OstA family protein [Thermanaerovibrio acidaminovorans]ACZ19468.1 OstA family protein [Thermanaerovibrio acidaminovorans DSM 6589]